VKKYNALINRLKSEQKLLYVYIILYKILYNYFILKSENLINAIIDRVRNDYIVVYYMLDF